MGRDAQGQWQTVWISIFFVGTTLNGSVIAMQTVGNWTRLGERAIRR